MCVANCREAPLSIYATLWTLKVARDGVWASEESDYIEVWCQAVPAHIGHPTVYPKGDPYADFLPPPVVGDPDDPKTPARAVVICAEGITTKGTARSGQEYVNPLLVMTGEEYASARFDVLLDRILVAVPVKLGLSRTIAVIGLPDGTIRRVTESDLDEGPGGRSR